MVDQISWLPWSLVGQRDQLWAMHYVWKCVYHFLSEHRFDGAPPSRAPSLCRGPAVNPVWLS